MKPSIVAVAMATALALALAGPPVRAADMAAGKAKAEAVCAACHGANGVSVADAIPNLAGQKAAYLEAQLKALKDGSRKNAVMAAIASQLSADDIANVAAHFAGLPVAGGAQKSDFLPQLARSAVPFPEDYKASYVRYHTINFPATKQVRHYYANPVALKAAREGRALPDGSMLLAEVHAARLDADNKPITGADGFYQPDKLLFYTAMGRDKGWGAAVPDMLRNEDWNYAAFTTARLPRTGVNQAECLACHKPLDKQSFTFTIKELATAAMR